MSTAALIILTRGFVDPSFLYGLDPKSNRGSDLRVRTLVVDDSDAAAAGTPHPVHRPETEVLVQTDLPLRRGTLERLGIGLLAAWAEGVDPVFVISDRVVLPNTFAQFYDEALSGCDRRFVSESGWLNPLAQEEAFSPGFPLHLRAGWTYDFRANDRDGARIVGHMGLTRGNPELSTVGTEKQIDHPRLRTVSLWPDGWFPVSYMNFGARRDLIPAMLPVPLGHKASAVLAGLLMQALCRHRGEALTLGRPIVRRLDAPQDNFLEIQELMVQPAFTAMLDRVVPQISRGSYLDMVEEFARQLRLRDLSPWGSLFETWPELLLAWVKALRRSEPR